MRLSNPLVQLAIFIVGVTLIAAPAAQGETAVSLQLSPDGGLEVKAPAYQARIGSDGNLHSLRVGETEMLDDETSFSLGAFFYSDGPVRPGTISLVGPAQVRASDGVFTIDYYFLPGEIRLTLAQSSEKKALFYLVLSQSVMTAANVVTGVTASIPAEEAWPDVTFAAASGAYLTLRGGDRIWGPGIGRQMWELGPLLAGPVREISISPGMGQPPKPTPAQLLTLQAEAEDREQVLGLGRSAELLVTVENHGDALPDGLLTVVLKDTEGETVSELAQEITVEAKSQSQVVFDIALPEPGIYSAQVVLSADQRPLKETSLIFVFRAEDIRPALSTPPDFDAFWAAASEEARTFSGDPTEFVEQEDLSTEQLKVWRVSFNGAGGKRLSGWLCVPARPGPHPGILQLPGYGRPKVEPPKVLAGRGYVALAAEVVEEGTDTAYIARGLQGPKDYPYRAVVINALRAFALLAGRPEVDPQRIATSGAGQGGGLALMVAALRPEVAAVAADVPMLCDLPRSIREGVWPYREIARYLQANPDAEPQARRTLSYFDALNFAPRINAPVLLSLGLKDNICRPEGIFAVGNYLAGRKEIKVYSDAGHEGGGSAHWTYKLQWLDARLKPNTAAPAGGAAEGEERVEPTAPER